MVFVKGMVPHNKGLGSVVVHCPDCFRPRVIRNAPLKQESFTGRCRPCASRLQALTYLVPLRTKRDFMMGDKHPRWKGGRTHRYGYVMVLLRKDNPYYEMANSLGYIPEHRYVMAKKLGRVLDSVETVHHLNGIKDDNRIENLQLINHETNVAIARYEIRIRELEEEVRKLKNGS